MKKLLLYCAAILLITTKKVFAADPVPLKQIRISFTHRAGTAPLVLGDTLVTASGEKITVQRFKYYVSNFTVTDSKGNLHVLPASYFLVDEAEPASKTFLLAVPDLPIRSISFLIGVDSIRNVSGIQTGALDPLKGMFWTWNSGYIMAKMEGTCEGLQAAGQRFTYHIGGFRFGVNTARQVSIDLPAGKNNFSGIGIAADIQQWFSSAWNIRIKETPVCHAPGALAVKFANNYMHMFSLQFLH